MSSNRKMLSAPIKIRVTFNDELLHEQVYHDFPVVIGRNENCDITLKDFDYISRQHVVVTMEDDNLHFIDLQSANGFLFQGILTRKLQIHRQTSITIGLVEITVVKLNEETKHESTDTTATELDVPVVKTSILEVQTKDENYYLDEVDKKTSGEEILALKKAPPVAPTNKVIEVDNCLVIQSTERTKSLLTQHPYASSLNVKNRVLETYVQWLDQVYDHKNFYPNTKINLGSSPRANLRLPFIKDDIAIAYYDEKSSQCLIPNGSQATLNRAGKDIGIKELISAGLVARKARGYILQLQNEDVLNVKYADTANVIFRYAPAPKRLSKKPMLNPDEEIKKSFTVSFFIHFFIIFLAFLSPPPEAPEIKNVPKRYAKLLIQPPKKIIELPKRKPKPTPAPTPQPVQKKPEVVKKQRPKPVKKKRIVQKKPIKKQVIKRNQEVQKVNRQPVKKPEPNIQALGALAALGNIKPQKNQQQVAVNINKNAGGSQKSFNTKGLVSNLKTKSGKLASSGGQNVKTKGLGVGSGKGFGTQGLSGRAGKRQVGGAVVGSPNLAKSSKVEGLSRKQVMETLQKYLSKIQRCYERSLFDNPDLKGRVEYQWEISSAGKVEWAKVIKSDMSGAGGLNSCVKDVFLSMKFPRAKNGQSTIPKIGFPFGRL